MEFEFDKFIEDINKRSLEESQKKSNRQEEIDLDKQRRLRAQQYHERWQNRIVWERHK